MSRRAGDYPGDPTARAKGILRWLNSGRTFLAAAWKLLSSGALFPPAPSGAWPFAIFSSAIQGTVVRIGEDSNRSVSTGEAKVAKQNQLLMKQMRRNVSGAVPDGKCGRRSPGCGIWVGALLRCGFALK